ncbi:MAG: cytochrome c [Gammaproteobacteria bacterium]|nr:cytochrome c [Gammaproteobacteria bacterium]
MKMARKRARLSVTIIVLIGFSSTIAKAGELPAERQSALLHLLKHDCGSCHGMTLKGGLGPSLLPEDLAGKPAVALERIVSDGVPGTPMPPWKTLLSPAEVSWLVNQLLQGVTDAP